MRDTHTWKQVTGLAYKCEHCPVTGKRVGIAWPPILDAAYIQPEYRDCATATAAAVKARLKQLGAPVDDIAIITPVEEE